MAGLFYPQTKKELAEQIDEFLSQAKPLETKGLNRALIVPHAGYVYSGKTAAYAYKILRENPAISEGRPIRVILIGSSHQMSLQGAVIDQSDAWQTPLGEVEVDEELREGLLKASSLFKVDAVPHQTEHSLEVQLPFLQRVLSRFKILPVLVSDLSNEETEKISQVLAENMDDAAIIIASSDLSHYPSYDDANLADKETIGSILTGQWESLEKTLQKLEASNIPNAMTFLCAKPAVAVVIGTAQKLKAKNIRLLHYSNSGDSPIGDKSQVVGYGAVVFTNKISSF